MEPEEKGDSLNASVISKGSWVHFSGLVCFVAIFQGSVPIEWGRCSHSVNIYVMLIFNSQTLETIGMSLIGKRAIYHGIAR